MSDLTRACDAALDAWTTARAEVERIQTAIASTERKIREADDACSVASSALHAAMAAETLGESHGDISALEAARDASLLPARNLTGLKDTLLARQTDALKAEVTTHRAYSQSLADLGRETRAVMVGRVREKAEAFAEEYRKLAQYAASVNALAGSNVIHIEGTAGQLAIAEPGDTGLPGILRRGHMYVESMGAVMTGLGGMTHVEILKASRK